MTDENWMRISFELEREDNPPLFEELMKFPKGTKRVNRLRTLAHEGFRMQQTWGRYGTQEMVGMGRLESDAVPASVQTAMGEASHELFGPALGE